MTQYIDKAAVVAEIERRRSIAAGWETYSTGINDTEFELCNDLLSFIDTLEVKEVKNEPYVMGKTGRYSITTK